MVSITAVPFARIALPLAAVGLAAGLNAPAYAAPAPTDSPAAQVELQAAVQAAEAPVGTINGPADLVSTQIAAADGRVSAATILPGVCAPSGSSARSGLSGEASRVLDCTHQAFPAVTQYLGIGHRAANAASDHPNGRAVDVMIEKWDSGAGKAQGWRVANFVAANAQDWNVKYVIWDAKIYSTGSGTWKAYRHPSGATDANNMHLNHVHVSTRN